MEDAVRNKICGLIARRWNDCDTLALLSGLEKNWGYQSIELRIALSNLFIEINKEMLRLIKKVKKMISAWKIKKDGD